MRLPHPPPSATRFWAKPLSAWLECPRCGAVLYFMANAARTTRSNCDWDPRTNRLQCHDCKLVSVIGLIAWPVQSGGSNRPRTAPRDAVPNERQLAQLRSMGGEGAGWWMPKDQAKGPWRPDDTNATAKCTCRTVQNEDPDCPLHGIPQTGEQINEDEWPR